ncbi:UDP-glucuronosyltransferase 1A5-like [Lineus longissimus]|uniref:UDP-glucuronosyltransferase 1A5-like n=1 Tax=Lineus longissimus TaxID=88925 RepID=UPI00315CA1E1
MEVQHFIAVLFVLFTDLHVNEGKKIVMLPLMIRSRFLQMMGIAEPLMDKGHQVYMTVDRTYELPSEVRRSRMKIMYYDTGRPLQANLMSNVDALIETFRETNFVKKGIKAGVYFKALADDCHNFLQTEDIMSRLKSERFDFAIVEGSSVSRCYYIVAHILGIPYASLGTFHSLDIASAASQAHYLVPSLANPDSLLTGQTLVMRLAGVFHTILLSRKVEADFRKYAADKPYSSLYDLACNSELWLLDAAPQLSVPMPEPPNVIHVGGLSSREARPISDPRLKQFVDKAEAGFIFISFGSMLENYPSFLQTILLDVMQKLPLKVVWKNANISNIQNKIPANVFVSDWLPQNDVLGHPNVKLFITHCGSGGQHEALFHAVPMVGVPLWVDQQFNARKLVKFGFGRFVDSQHLTTDRLLAEIDLVLSNQSYKDNIVSASKMFRDQPMKPRETAAYWIEHVMKYGGSHLRSSTLDMPWYQLIMVDVLCVLILVLIFSMFVTWMIIRCVCRSCCKRTTKIKRA